jgi:hypothetical protein
MATKIRGADYSGRCALGFNDESTPDKLPASLIGSCAGRVLSMRIGYRLSFDDYYDASRVRNAKSRHLQQGVISVASLMLFATWMRTGTARFGLLALLALSSLFLAWWIGKRSFENAYRKGATRGANQEFTVDISEEGIQGADSTDREEWS